jgi:hypothetical protein
MGQGLHSVYRKLLDWPLLSLEVILPWSQEREEVGTFPHILPTSPFLLASSACGCGLGWGLSWWPPSPFSGSGNWGGSKAFCAIQTTGPMCPPSSPLEGGAAHVSSWASHTTGHSESALNSWGQLTTGSSPSLTRAPASQSLSPRGCWPLLTCLYQPRGG